MAVVPNMMLYKDFNYCGYKYRAVKINQYRPSETMLTTSANNSYQDDNGYTEDTEGTIYYFKFEPIEWRVLDPATGYVMCNTIIDSQAFQNCVYVNSEEFNYYNSTDYKYYASDWAMSSIRTWLNEDFYKTAFTTDEQAKISETSFEADKYDSTSTDNHIFLLSYNDVTNNSYGFNADTDRKLQGSEYAKCQGLEVIDSYSLWRLRSVYYSDSTNYVNYNGYTYNGNCYYVNKTDGGIVPAFHFNQTTTFSETKETITPILLIDNDNYWTASYDGGLTFTSLDVKATGTNGADGKGISKVEIIDNCFYVTYTDSNTPVNLGKVTGADGINGQDGQPGTNGKDGKDGNTPLLRINEDGIWEISYDNGETYTSLGVSATTGGTVKQGTRTFFQKVADFFRNIFASIKRVFTR